MGKTPENKRIIKIKKIFLLLLVPLLMATQCDDDLDNSGFETTYFIQNDSSFDLFLLSEGDAFVEIESQSVKSIGSALNSATSSIVPSESYAFSNIKLYKMDQSNFILAYEQTSIDNNLWVFNEPSINSFKYTLVITDELLD
jgi:hypothetical protein